MRIEYDREADALYIHLRAVPVDDNIGIEEGVTVDLDTQRHIVGIEILDARTRLSREELSRGIGGEPDPCASHTYERKGYRKKSTEEAMVRELPVLCFTGSRTTSFGKK